MLFTKIDSKGGENPKGGELIKEGDQLKFLSTQVGEASS
jgi:hypothetical protein